MSSRHDRSGSSESCICPHIALLSLAQKGASHPVGVTDEAQSSDRSAEGTSRCQIMPHYPDVAAPRIGSVTNGFRPVQVASPDACSQAESLFSRTGYSAVL